MKRTNPVGSLPGIALTFILLIGLGFSLWYKRGLAFNPGPVTGIVKEGIVIQGYKSHAEFERQCSQCHEPLETDLATKCKKCHVNVEEQIINGQGAHSHLAIVNNCTQCHAEHRGRDFNPTITANTNFDHTNTNFSLKWHQTNYNAAPMMCADCHTKTEFNVVGNQTCIECHGNHDLQFTIAHQQDFGTNCRDCHDGLDRMNNFDHETTGYQLAGKHSLVKCSDCHKNENLTDTPQVCSECHTESAMHKGLFTETCDSCHNSESWTPAVFHENAFSHFETTGFSLEKHQADYLNQPMTCSSCHPTGLDSTDIQLCVDCHDQTDQVFMADHLLQFGSECLICHDGVDRLSNFDHTNFFPLEGMHASAQCESCHMDLVFRGTFTECWQCHNEPEIHAGVFGLKCDYCHNAEAWSPASLRKHTFPINHGQVDPNVQTECETCHGLNYFEYTCYVCHDHQPDEITQSHKALDITEHDLPACANCHADGTLKINLGNP